MGENILKNTGKVILLFLLIFTSTGLHAADIKTELSDSKIAVGESATLNIKITGKSSKVTPVKFPAVDGLHISFTGSSRSFQFVNGKSWSGTVLSFSITAEKKGEYIIPPFVLETDGVKISSAEVKLTVSESSAHRGGGGGPLRGDVELTSETVYIGEPFLMRYFIDNSGGNFPDIKGFSEQPHTKGFVMKGIDERLDIAGKTHAGSFCLVPLDKGIHEIGGGSVEVLIEIPRGFFSMDRRGRINFSFKKINVIPIPPEGKPLTFAGDVGEFKIEADLPAGDFKPFEEIKIPVRISGRGNFLTLSKPRIENEDGFKAIVEEREQVLSLEGRDLAGTKNFIVTLIPQKEGKINPGRIFMEYFNPYKKSYQRAESVPLGFDIQKGVNTGEKGEVQFSEESSASGSRNYVYAFPVLAVLAVSVILLVLWERRKLSIIRDEIKGEISVEEAISPAEKNNDVLKNIQISAKEKNSDTFLQNADRGINRIDYSKLSGNELVKYNIFKENIYYCPYGGGGLSEDDMKELGEWLMRHLN